VKGRRRCLGCRSFIEGVLVLVIVDYGHGNLGSIKNMLKKIGVKDVIVSGNPDVIALATKLILPGVGAFASGMLSLRERKLVGPLERKVLGEKVPILGICLGMQLFSQRSEEGPSEGLGWVEAETVRFAASDNLKIPHMGWNSVRFRVGGGLGRGIERDARFYFVHSYHVRVKPPNALATASYGEDFVAALQCDNIVGVQFHPEKSHNFGMALLKNFADQGTASALSVPA
jgi:glutamine amidotransferase